MKEQFDKELRDHIKDTFDVFNDGLAHDGWKHYQRKLRNKKRRAFVLWSLPTSIAAAITFFLLTNINQTEPVINETVLLAETPKVVSSEKVVKENPQRNTQKEETAKNLSSETETMATVINPVKNIPTAKNKVQIAMASANLSELSALERISLIAVNLVTDSAIIAKEKTIALDTEQLVQAIAKSIFTKDEPIYSSISSTSNQSFAYTENKDSRSVMRKLKNVKVSIDASTFMNFSKEGINDDVNLAVGVISEYKLSKNFSINSGINVNRQTASFVQDIAPPLENTQNAMALTNSIASAINGHFTNAKLVGLDIPLAVKYTTAGKKLNWFISTGFSSYTLINEKYLNNFSVVNYGFAGVETKNLTTEEERSDSPFSNFQLASSINFSTGISFPVKNITTLSIEPFVKYPLRSFGQERLSLGSGGISFKMNLNRNLFKY